jgi:hypothetical protein
MISSCATGDFNNIRDSDSVLAGSFESIVSGEVVGIFESFLFLFLESLLFRDCARGPKFVIPK